MSCELCGAKENLQKHHVSYNPKIIVPLCGDCHTNLHGHGTGKRININTERFVEMWKLGSTYTQITQALGISDTAIQTLRKFLNLVKRGPGPGPQDPMKKVKISVSIDLDLLNWIMENLQTEKNPEGKFKSISHAINTAIMEKKIKEDVFG